MGARRRRSGRLGQSSQGELHTRRPTATASRWRRIRREPLASGFSLTPPSPPVGEVSPPRAAKPVTADDLVAWGMPRASAFRHFAAAHRSGEYAVTVLERTTSHGARRKVRAVILTAAQIAATQREIASR